MKRILLIFMVLLFAWNATYVFAKEVPISKNVLTENILKVHPWGIYLLYGNIADSKNIIVGIDLKAVEKSNAIADLKLMSDGNWKGFKTDEFVFKYRVYKQILPNYFILECAYLPYGSGSFGCHLLVQKEKKIFYDNGKQEIITVLFSKGIFNKKPSNKELNKIILELKQEKAQPHKVKKLIRE